MGGPEFEKIDHETAEAAVAAYRAGDLDTLEAIGRRLNPVPMLEEHERRVRAAEQSSTPAEAASGPAAPAKASGVILPRAYLERGRVALEHLTTESPDPAADEKILNEFVADELVILAALDDARRQLCALLLGGIAGSKYLLMTSRVLGEVIRLTSAIERRVEGSLTTAATLRSARQLFAATRRGRS
jgi:hypothetical protein